MRIGFLTCKDLPGLIDDDRCAVAPLASLGHTVVPVVWNSESPWRDVDALVVRSMWDYHLRREEFLSFLDSLDSARIPVINPVPTIRWNCDKLYLRDLEQRGVAIVPTEFVPRASTAQLSDILESRGWRQAVVKPSFSATAYETWLTHEEPSPEARFQKLLRDHTLLVQQYQPQIRTEGEWSLHFFGGEFSHAVRKRAAPGDFRVQDDFGGTAHSDPPPAGFVAQASQLLERLPVAWTYARVDGIEQEGRLLVMELELIEPLLHLAWDPEAPARFARALHRSRSSSCG